MAHRSSLDELAVHTTSDCGKPSMVGEYVPDPSQPHAVQFSENNPPCIACSIREEAQAGQKAELAIGDVVRYEPT